MSLRNVKGVHVGLSVCLYACVLAEALRKTHTGLSDAARWCCSRGLCFTA